MWWSSAADPKILCQTAALLVSKERSTRPHKLVAKIRGKAANKIFIFFLVLFYTCPYVESVCKMLWEGTWCATARKCCYYIATKHSVLQTAHPGISFFFTKAFCNTPTILLSCSFQKTCWSLKKIKYRQDFQGCLNGLVAQILLKGHSPRRYVLCCLCSVFRVL